MLHIFFWAVAHSTKCLSDVFLITAWYFFSEWVASPFGVKIYAMLPKNMAAKNFLLQKHKQ